MEYCGVGSCADQVEYSLAKATLSQQSRLRSTLHVLFLIQNPISFVGYILDPGRGNRANSHRTSELRISYSAYCEPSLCSMVESIRTPFEDFEPATGPLSRMVGPVGEEWSRS